MLDNPTKVLTTNSDQSKIEKLMKIFKHVLVATGLPYCANSFSVATTTKSNIKSFQKRISSSSLFPLHAGASDLSTAYEWLADQNELDLEWLQPASIIDNESELQNDSSNSQNDKISTMPLYPLEACYIPYGMSSTVEEEADENDNIDYVFLNNVEPRNIKMALDLKQQQLGDGGNAKFCAVLKAVDTGRIATVGTILRIVEFDEQYLWDGKTIARIRLKCIPETRVKILNVCNPKAWSRENRLLRSDEYLVANIQHFNDIDVQGMNSDDQDVAADIVKEYETVKKMYQTCKKLNHDFPPFALHSIESLPELDPIIDEKSFWRAVHVWQQLCFIVKEAMRVNLQSIIDEKTISAAIKNGGPLNLPIHREDLPFDVRKELNKLEDDTAHEFIRRKMEPCLNFQQLLSTTKFAKRLLLLRALIMNERMRIDGLK